MLETKLLPDDPRFGVGPSRIPQKHLQALAETGYDLMGTGHRRQTVKELIKNIQQGLGQYFHLPPSYNVVLGNGGATLLFDAIGLGLVKKTITHFVCGEFSAKWYKSSDAIPWIEAIPIKKNFSEGITPFCPQESDTLAVTLNETSTGVMVDELPTPGVDTLLCLDATSGAGQIPWDIDKVDVAFFSPQKIFSSDGGLFIAILSPKAMKRVEEIAADSSRYIPPIMSWSIALENAKKHQTYTTPALATLFLLNKQIEKMNRIGSEKIFQESLKKAELIYTWAEEKDYLSCYIKEKLYRSLSVATIDVEPQIDVPKLLKYLAEKKQVYDINSYRKLGRNQFRISLFYNIDYSELEKLTRLLSHLIESGRFHIHPKKIF